MKQHLRIAILYTLFTGLLLGIAYPFAITGIAQVLFPKRANGGLIMQNDKLMGSRLIGQAFSGPKYFHSRPSAAGNGYDAQASSGSNLSSASAALVDRVKQSVHDEQQPSGEVPVDLVTASGSGLDPDITPAAAYYQAPRIAAQRHLSEPAVRALIASHITPRQFGLLGEDRVNVLELNLALDSAR